MTLEEAIVIINTYPPERKAIISIHYQCIEKYRYCQILLKLLSDEEAKKYDCHSSWYNISVYGTDTNNIIAECIIQANNWINNETSIS